MRLFRACKLDAIRFDECLFPYVALSRRPEQIIAVPTGYNQLSIQLLSGGGVRLSFVGMAGANYALDNSSSLMPASWVPLVTNPAGSGGALVFTITPNEATNNFWRMRFVP